MHTRPQSIYLYVGFVENGRGQPALLFQQREQQVFDINLLVSVRSGKRLRSSDSLLHFLGEAIEIHDYLF